MKTILFLSLFSVFLFSCKSQQYTIDELPAEQLVFGNGGGITGEVSTYTLLENGQVFYNNSLTKEHTEMESLAKKVAKSSFKKLEALKLFEVNFDHPGNMYYFLEEIKGDSIHRVTWGSSEHEISEACKAFYKELRTTIK